MMLTVYKYQVKPNEDLLVPGFKRLLDINSQHGDICAWALVDIASDHPLSVKKIKVLIKGTGHSISEEQLEDMKFFKTIQLDGGALIFHIWIPEDIRT
jgi:hypothetical protein